jgi:predicted phosphodiesterase
MNDPDYNRQVAAALDAAYARAHERPAHRFDMYADRLIIFSDQHRGARNGADDFLRSERAYNAALAYYHRLGHTLVVLGDAEELWEEFPWSVTRAYAHTLTLEGRFHKDGRYLRVWGNHDDDWNNADSVARYLTPFFGEGLPVPESLRLTISDGLQELGTLFLLHGHQGDATSDHLAWLSRWVVRWVWRPIQRLFRISLNTPSKDWQLREKHNIALYSWAEKQAGLVLVAGHTHRPVFKSQTRAEQLERELERLSAETRRGADKRERAAVARLAAELEWTRAQDFNAPGDEGAATPMNKPCYFNTGCCCYIDGDITGLELAEGEIRLVRWPDDGGQPRPKILAAAPLKDVLAACSSTAGAAEHR